MKTYVVGYQTNETNVALLDVRYGAQPLPDAKFPTRSMAEAECKSLNRSGIHVGSHRCSFSVDALPAGGYGIICVCHPF